MMRFIEKSYLFLLVVAMAVTFTLVGCDDMMDENHNNEDGRNGASGFSLIVTITPSRAPANGSATMNVHVRFIRLDDLSPVANQVVRLAIDSLGYELDPDIVSFAEDTLMTTVRTNGNGDASTTMYVGTLARSVPEVAYMIDAQATVEYEYFNSVTVDATEPFYIYNPFWDGTRPADTTLPTAVISFFPSTGITPGTTITFMGGNSYDRGDSDPTFGRAYDEITAWNWNFADGSGAQGKTVTHLYAGVGTYQVELMVVDDEGMTGSAVASVSVVANTPTPTP
ncbi:MAG TPA: PKD domain-containing protein [bacterium]|nr:PKD domain-containing protein [bacterium]